MFLRVILLVIATTVIVQSQETPAPGESTDTGVQSSSQDVCPLANSTALSKYDNYGKDGSVHGKAVDLIEMLREATRLLLAPLSDPVGFLLSALLFPIIVLVRVLLWIVKLILDVLLGGLTKFLLGPLLSLLGLGDVVKSLNCLLEVVDVLLEGVSCVLSMLTFFPWLVPGGCSAFESTGSTPNACSEMPLANLLRYNDE